MSFLLAWLFIFSAAVETVQSSTCNGTAVCWMRYDIAKEMHALRGVDSCQGAYDFHCICSMTIDILYIDHPPYIYTDPKTKKVIGLLTGMLEQALGACCFNSSCTNIRYLKPYTTANEVIRLLSEITLTMPLVLYSTAKSATGSTFIPLIKTKGVTYISSEDMSVLYFDKFVRSIVSNWPLFMISMLLALDAGIIVWLLDCWQNEKDFPREFHVGAVEGLWWAFVSMTTVGYGDKTPKSIQARAFGILWVTIGISLIGIFTAALTTGMTESLTEEALQLESKRVGVMNKTRYELNMAMREGATVTVFSTYEEMKNALRNDAVDGILIDSLVLKYYREDLENSGIPNLHIRPNAVLNTDTSYGMAFSFSESNSTNKKWSTFLEEFFLENIDNLDVMLQKAGQNLPSAMHVSSNELAGTKSIFNSPVIYKRLFKVIGIATLVLVVIGFLFEKLRSWVRLFIASKQARWENRIEMAVDNSEASNSDGKLDSKTVIRLRESFKLIMKEIELSDNVKDLSEIVALVNDRVFQTAENQSFDEKRIELEQVTKKSYRLEEN
eukprot:Seg1611.1 transcript_id=Seg1611.1/GoldUCD/mRNA.D3Y31 product="putative potassium channel protein YugO" protein_id=Seg1611.1/GoldUCD/D3Y31